MIALRERHLGQEAERHAAAFAIVQAFLDPTRLFDEGHAGFEIAGHEEQHPFDRHRDRLQEVADAAGTSCDRFIERRTSVVHPPEAQAAVADTHHALGCRFRVADRLAVFVPAGPLAERALPFAGRGGDHPGGQTRERAATARRSFAASASSASSSARAR